MAELIGVYTGMTPQQSEDLPKRARDHAALIRKMDALANANGTMQTQEPTANLLEQLGIAITKLTDERDTLRAALAEVMGVVRLAHSALDDALGDTDVMHIEDDDELRTEEPVQWAAQKLAALFAKHGGGRADVARCVTCGQPATGKCEHGGTDAE